MARLAFGVSLSLNLHKKITRVAYFLACKICAKQDRPPALKKVTGDHPGGLGSSVPHRAGLLLSDQPGGAILVSWAETEPDNGNLSDSVTLKILKMIHPWKNPSMGGSSSVSVDLSVFLFDEDLINLCFKVFLIRSSQVSRRMEFSIATVRALLPEAPFYLLSDGGPSRLGREG